MHSFRNNRLRDHEIPLNAVWLLNDISEARGKQELFTRQSPQALRSLRDAAVVQSVESSNRIEGVSCEWIRTLLAELKKSGDVACRGPRAGRPLAISRK